MISLPYVFYKLQFVGGGGCARALPLTRSNPFWENLRKPQAVYCCEFSAKTSGLENPKNFQKRVKFHQFSPTKW